ncbi:MAG: flagellar hook-basal body complex protein [Chloroflexi bacterium]|nr:flagellar hook-basal body complex protein [Chloroflexota bacterium]
MPFTPHSVLHTNSVGMMARQFEMDVTADNLANLNTPGFIASRANFQEYLFDKVPASLMNGPYRGAAVRPNTSLSYTLGPMVQSGNPTDLAIFGPGFFRVQMPDGTTGYTRNGAFKRDAEGNLVTSSGLRLIWGGTIPSTAKDIRVTADGTVEVRVGQDWESAGQITMAIFENSSGMINAGGSTYTADESSGPPIIGTPKADGFGSLVAGMVEQSGVSLQNEVAQMMLAQRAYSMSLRSLQTSDEMLTLAIRLRG